ncbi:helix-turn-helix domain-containing protein [Stappia indica]|uniref:Transcriptional regulator, AraC family n=1 Tax=Stappia indica TaxID=538381 RepID=A0A285SBC6_9HYPH|nr:helix-turn-helix domain-containing protein [Stappia indica]SOC04427.1 transcriptional regulator, AraC family [Stappia indica]
MLVLPIPLAVALVLAFLACRFVLLRDGPSLFPMLLGAAAMQGTLISLVQHYGVAALQPVLPVTAALVPPLAYLAFRQAAIRAPALPGALPHAAAPLIAALAVLLGRGSLHWLPDVALVALYAGYGTAILFQARGREDLPLARLEAGHLPRRIWQVVGASLLLSAASDTAIAFALMSGAAWLRPLLVSLTSSLALLAVGLLGLVAARPGSVEEDEGSDSDETVRPGTDTQIEADRELMARLDSLLDTGGACLDPDLTLARLARRLHVPMKQLSAAINRMHGENVSRHVNGYRIRHACKLLADGHSVTAAMLASGFNTKSNFNREFLRVTGETPSAFRARLSTS